MGATAPLPPLLRCADRIEWSHDPGRQDHSARHPHAVDVRDIVVPLTV
jgi:hypothetical protein